MTFLNTVYGFGFVFIIVKVCSLFGIGADIALMGALSTYVAFFEAQRARVQYLESRVDYLYDLLERAARSKGLLPEEGENVTNS